MGIMVDTFPMAEPVAKPIKLVMKNKMAGNKDGDMIPENKFARYVPVPRSEITSDFGNHWSHQQGRGAYGNVQFFGYPRLPDHE